MDNLLFTFVVSKEIKDDVTDQLLANKVISGFNLTTIMGYSKEHCSFSLEEQVRGYQNMYQFEVVLPASYVSALKQCLKDTLHASNIRYWLTPIIETGHI